MPRIPCRASRGRARARRPGRGAEGGRRLGALHPRRGDRGRRDERFGRGGAAPQEGLFAAGGGQPGQAARRPAVAGAGLRFRRQHRRPDGGLALCAQDRRRHRPAGDRHRDAERARRLHHRPRPGRQRRLQRREPAAVRGHGQRPGRRGRWQGRAHGRPAQHRRRGDQGQRYDQAGRRAAARGGCGRAGQLLRQCRRQRHLQGQLRHRRLRRLRRQCRAEDGRGPGNDAHQLHQAGIHPQPADQAGGARRPAGAQPPEAPRRSPPLQRRRAPRPARPGVQEPRLGRRLRLRAGAQPRPRRRAQRSARARRAAHPGDPGGDAGHRRRPADDRRRRADSAADDAARPTLAAVQSA